MNACHDFIRSVGGSEYAQHDRDMHYGLAILSMPSSAANLTKAFEALPLIQKHLPRLRMVYCKVFRENSIKLRTQLFSNELMQCVWMLYAHDEAAEI